MSKVILKGHIIIPERDFAAVVDELSSHIALTRAEKGCLVFEVSQDSENRLRFNVYEEFDSAESFQCHQRRAQASNWGRISVNVERNYTIERVGD